MENKSIPGFSRYFASSDGRIFNVRSGAEVVGAKNRYGYVKHTLIDDDKRKRSVTAHTVIALAFFGARPNGFDVCHMNGIRHDNKAENLRYDTKKGNAADRIKHGTHMEAERTPAAKLSNSQALEVVRLLREKKMTQQNIAALVGVSQSAVCNIARGRSWRSITGGSVDCYHTAGARKLSESDVIMVFDMRDDGKSMKDIADIVGSTTSNVCMILSGRSWKQVFEFRRERQARAA